VTGTLTFLRAFLKRDRWFFLWFGIGVPILYVSQAWSVDGLYATQAEFDRAAAGMEGNAALVAMAGPARALNTTGGQVTWQASAFGAIVVGLMVMALVGRHTRTEEETGRDELLRAAPVGRYATTTAALIEAALASVVVGALVAASLVAYGLATADSVGLGVGAALSGWFFAGVALLAAQLVGSARGTYGLVGAALGLAYGLRAVGDVSAPALSWMSPIGWYQAMHAFSGLRWWPALLLVVGGVALAAAAYAVFDRRDFGAGVLATRPGPAHAGRGLRSGLGLAWRLQRPAFLGWAFGLAVAGLSFGVMGNDVGDLVGDSDLSRKMILELGGSVADAFYAAMLAMLAAVGAGFAISSALRPYSEEESGRLEPVLATALSRSRWLLGHVVITVLGTAVVLLLSGLGVGTTYALVTGDGGAVVRMTLDMASYLPAVLVLSGVARLLHGAVPRAARAAWLGLLVVWVVLIFGDVLRLPQWLQDLSPFEHLAPVPAQSFSWAPFLALSALALALSVAGQVAFVRRDVH
jgi:ABC-2 type transport system permease protein